jgi:DNA-binding response OmpR family regulator
MAAGPERIMTRWLIVEDEPSMYDTLQAITQLIGIDGLLFTDGEQALAWLDEAEAGLYQEEMPQLALLDIRLPGDISGPAIGAKLRASASLPKIVIVLMTAYRLSARDERKMLRDSGADLILYKPLPSIKVLQKKLAELVAKRAVQRDGHVASAPKPVQTARSERKSSDPAGDENRLSEPSKDRSSDLGRGTPS